MALRPFGLDLVYARAMSPSLIAPPTENIESHALKMRGQCLLETTDSRKTKCEWPSSFTEFH